MKCVVHVKDMTMLHRRKLFSFLMASPVVAIGTIAKASQPTEIDVDRIKIGDVEISSFDSKTAYGIKMQDIHNKNSTTMSFQFYKEKITK